MFKPLAAIVMIFGLSMATPAFGGEEQLPEHLTKFCDAQVGYLLEMQLENSREYKKSLESFRINTLKHENDTFEFTQKYVAQSMIREALLLHKFNRHDEAVIIYDEVLRRYEDSRFIPLMDQVAWALNNKAFTVAKKGKHAEALVLYERFFRRSPETATRQFNRAKCLATRNRARSLAAVRKKLLLSVERCQHASQGAIAPPANPVTCKDARLSEIATIPFTILRD